MQLRILLPLSLVYVCAGVGCEGAPENLEDGFDSPYADPGSGARDCPKPSYLVGQRCVSRAEELTPHTLPWRVDGGAMDGGLTSIKDAGFDARANDASRAGDSGDATLAIDIVPSSTCLSGANRFAIAGDDYIYRGPGILLDDSDGGFTQLLTLDDAGAARSIDFSVLGWRVSFSSRELDAGLTTALYSDAERAPFASAGHPGLSISGHGRGCNTLSGEFEVFDLRVSPVDPDAGRTSARLEHFHARFEQHCERGARYNVGCLHYTAPSP
jgi:hypothetical protein